MPSLPPLGRGVRVGRTALLCAILGACAGRSPHPRPPSAGDDAARIVTADRIEQMNATTAWDVVKRSGFMVTATPDKQGRPRALHTRRGRSSLYLAHSDTPLVILDGVRTHDFRVLEQVPASTVLYVRYVSGIEATVTQGTDAGGGLIEVRTRSDP